MDHTPLKIQASAIQGIRKRLKKIPRKDLAIRNTPLQLLHRLSERLDGPQVFIKRDDLTDLALGGNKARILDFVVAEASTQGADTIITTAFEQSNLCRQTAAAARKVGMEAILVLKGVPGESPKGNLLLDVMLDAELHFVDTKDGALVRSYINRLCDDLRKEGRIPYFYDPHSKASRFSAYAYLECFLEIISQSKEVGFSPSAIIVATASGGTQSGLELGSAILAPDIRVVGINPMEWSAEWIQEHTIIALDEAAGETGLHHGLVADDIEVLSDYKGSGYGIPSELSLEAELLFAHNEAIILDPTYTAKAAGAMIDLIRKGEFTKEDNIIFLHTGGVPTQFVKEHAYDIAKMKTLTEDAAVTYIGL